MALKHMPAKRSPNRRLQEQEEAIQESLSRVRRPGFSNAAVLDEIDDEDLDNDDIIDQSPEPEDDEDEAPVVKAKPKRVVEAEPEAPAKRNIVKRAAMKLDPGPDPKDVPFGLNCGSCKKFVKLDDPRRDDPEWLLSMSKKKDRCPLLFATDDWDLTQVPAEQISQYIPTADRPECDKYAVDENKCSDELREVITIARERLTVDELNVFNSMAAGIEKLKAQERKMGYRIGEIVEVWEEDKVYRSKVVDFQRRAHSEVIVQTLNRPGRQVRMSIPARRATRVKE